MADLIRDTFKRGKYQDVILPLRVLRRLDCVLAPTKPEVLAVRAKNQGRIENLDPLLRRASGFAFYNTSGYDCEKLPAGSSSIAPRLRNYIAGFSPNMREVAGQGSTSTRPSASSTRRVFFSSSCSGSAIRK